MDAINKINPLLLASRRLWRVVLLLALVAMWALQHAATIQAQQPNEFQVKATYLYNFGKFFVEWPKATAELNDSFVVCVLGQDPFGSNLDKTFQNERIGGKSAVTRRISKPADATNCRILYVSSSEAGHVKEILAKVGKTGVLTVSDIPEFSKLGGMVQFVFEGSKIRFEINRATAEGAGLTLSSELLRVAISVRNNP